MVKTLPEDTLRGSIVRGIRRTDAFDLFIVVFLFCVGVVTLYPIVNILSISISNPVEVSKGISWLPKKIDITAYQYILRHPAIPTGYGNSLIYTTVGTVINLVMTSICAYPLSKKDLFGRKVFTFLIVFTMFFGGGLIPRFLLVRRLGMYNTMWALSVPAAIGTFNMIILRTFFQRLPIELEESAFLDGGGYWRILWSIILPLSKAALATIGLFYALGHWNNFFTPLIYLRDPEKYPLPLIVRDIVLGDLLIQRREELQGVFDADREAEYSAYSLNFRYATLFVSIIPVLIVYPFIQKYFVKGIMIGSLKG